MRTRLWVLLIAGCHSAEREATTDRGAPKPPPIEVVEGRSNPRFVGAVAGSGKLTQARLDAPEPISVQLLGLLWNQPILASC